MKLTDLHATFVGNYAENPVSYQQLDSADGAQGLLFTCPKCQNHSVLCWFSNPRNALPVPDSASPKPGRWTFSGETIETVTLSPSVDISQISETNPESPNRCYWHGFVKNGSAE